MSFLENVPYVYDIVLSDFGRDAAIRLLDILVKGERTRIQQLLNLEGDSRSAPFFDEYRRIMFTCVGDLAYIKKDLLLERHAAKQSLLDSSILYGVEGTDVSLEAIERIAKIVTGEVEQAFGRDYRRFRLLIPCNTLSYIEKPLRKALDKHIHVHLPSFGGAKPFSIDNGNGHSRKINKNGELTVYTVPKAILKVVKSSNSKANLLLVGTALAREEYAKAKEELRLDSISIIEVNSEEQKIMDELLVASIGSDNGYVAAMKAELKRKILNQYHGHTHIIEASTDYTLGIGFNSLDMFASSLLDDVYGPINKNEIKQEFSYKP